MRRAYRHVVVGAGGIGSAAAYWLSRSAGDEVLCLEQFDLGHRFGASEDHSRIIRLGYHAARYTALAPGAYEAWRVVEAESGVPLVHATGCLNVGRPGTEGGDILDAYGAAMDAEGIAYERLGAGELRRRWPQFAVEDGHEAVFQPDGGILDIRRAVAVHLALARARGASVVPRTPVTGLRPDGDGVEVQTAGGPVRAERVLLCAGAWNVRLLSWLGLEWPIHLSREQVTYFATPNLAAYAPGRFPVWIWHGDTELYGFPVHGEVATKAADEELGEAVGLDEGSWEPDRERVRRLRGFLDEILPGYTGPELYTRCCLYDMPPDRDFVVDRVPGHPAVAVAVGAGHAAKFAGVLGRVLAELAVVGESTFPIAPFAVGRPALTDPSFAPVYRLGGGERGPGPELAQHAEHRLGGG